MYLDEMLCMGRSVDVAWRTLMFSREASYLTLRSPTSYLNDMHCVFEQSSVFNCMRQCVCVCEREREREKHSTVGFNIAAFR
jgi:hypothetical protein